MDNPNIALIKSIVALYINSNTSNPSPKVPIVVEEVLEAVRTSKNQSSEEEITGGLITTLEYLQYVGDAKKISSNEIIERIKLNCHHRNDYVITIENLLVLSDVESENREKVDMIISEIYFGMRKTAISKLIRKANRDLSFEDGLDLNGFSQELTEKLRAFESGVTEKGEKEGFAGRLSTNDPDSVIETFKKSIELNSTEGMLITGSKGLNKMWGGGHRRGGQYNYGACTGNYKTGILMDYCKWIPMYNTPNLIDKTKKPMVLRISFENKPEQDLPILYESMYEAEYKIKVKKGDIDPKEATKYVMEKLTKNGWTFEMLCYDPNTFDIWDLIDILLAYEDEGYEIAALIVDYPELITKKQRKGNVMRQDAYITYTFEVLRNHCFPRGITQFVAHQHSTEAQKIKRENPIGYVQQVANGSYYMNCQSLATKVDADCAMNIVVMGERKFLMFGRGKDRFNNSTPEKHKHPIIEFKRFGGIVADVNTEDDHSIYSFAGIDGGIEVAVDSEPKSVVKVDEDDW